MSDRRTFSRRSVLPATLMDFVDLTVMAFAEPPELATPANPCPAS
jgi:hypothetical protein